MKNRPTCSGALGSSDYGVASATPTLGQAVYDSNTIVPYTNSNLIAPCTNSNLIVPVRRDLAHQSPRSLVLWLFRPSLLLLHAAPPHAGRRMATRRCADTVDARQRIPSRGADPVERNCCVSGDFFFLCECRVLRVFQSSRLLSDSADPLSRTRQ